MFPRPADFAERICRLTPFQQSIFLTINDLDLVCSLLAWGVIRATPTVILHIMELAGPDGRRFLLHNADEFLIGGPHKISLAWSGTVRESTKREIFQRFEATYCLLCKYPWHCTDLDLTGKFCKQCARDLAFTGHDLAAEAKRLKTEWNGP